MLDPLDTTISLPPSRGPRVPNKFPSIEPTTYRLAIVGESPGQDEVSFLTPFIGMSGKLLDQILSKNSIARACCFVGNVCQYRPPGNDISEFSWEGEEIQEGLNQLEKDLNEFNPHCCLLLGKTALLAAHSSSNIGDWRGSVFVSSKGGPFLGRKCIASYHPAACLRQYDFVPLLTFDVKKALKESYSKTLTLPQRELIINLPYHSLVSELHRILSEKPTISCDIEGGVSSVSCVSLARSENHSCLIPLTNLDGTSYWTLEEEVTLVRLFAQIMGDPEIPKIWQNGLYDRFVLQWAYNIIIRHNKEDTMLKSWEMFCELEKSLGFLCSIFTDEPFYKFERKTEDQSTYFKYCCKDSAVTYEISNKLTKALAPKQDAHYRFNNTVLNSLLYMECRGIAYDELSAKRRLHDMQGHVYAAQQALDAIAISMGAIEGIDFTKSNPEILQQVQAICGKKKNPEEPVKKFKDKGYYEAIAPLVDGRSLDDSQKGAISILTGRTMNTKSPKFKTFLYDKKFLGLPIQYKKDPKTKESRVTSDYVSLLKLSKKYDIDGLKRALDLSLFRTRCQFLAIPSYKGRMHTSYNLVGSETGRVTSGKSMLYVTSKKRVGGNLQTMPDDWEVFDEDHPIRAGMRDLFIADEGCYLGKADLRGSDGWTIGAMMASIGDRTMLEDLRYGIKPAQAVAYILIKGEAEYKKIAHDRAALKAILPTIVKKDMWEYYVSKVGTWGACYTMGAEAIANKVFLESEGKVVLSLSQARDFLNCILVRYKIKQMQNWMQSQINKQSYPFKLEAPNGFIRRFFNRKSAILGEALAHLPQVVTTYATLMAAYRLWTDPENRIYSDPSDLRSCRLRIEPLHQVHDELLTQFKITDTEWAIGKIKQWFNNPMNLFGENITIEYDGSYGLNWSMDKDSKIGSL